MSRGGCKQPPFQSVFTRREKIATVAGVAGCGGTGGLNLGFPPGNNPGGAATPATRHPTALRWLPRWGGKEVLKWKQND